MSDKAAVVRHNIPWKNDWANYRAMDGDGAIWDSTGRIERVSKVRPWKESLEERES